MWAKGEDRPVEAARLVETGLAVIFQRAEALGPCSAEELREAVEKAIGDFKRMIPYLLCMSTASCIV